MKKIIIVLLMFSVSGSLTVKSQDIHFSQFTMTPLLLNPAQTGSQNDLRTILNYKNQWSSVAEAYKTCNFSFDMNLRKKKSITGFSAMGLDVFSDKAGDSKMGTFQGCLSYAYQVYTSDKSTLGGGLNVGFGQRSINYSNLQWGNQYDGSVYNSNLPTGETATAENFTYFDFGGGINWEYGKHEKYITGNDQRRYSAGIAIFHINQPKYSFYGSGEKLNMKEIAYVNALIGVGNSNLSVVPGIAYFRQGKANELLIGSMFQYLLRENSKYTGFIKSSAISMGAFYRNNDAIIVNVLYEFSQYAIGVSYDVNVSGLKSASNGRGGIEISLRFVSPNPFTGRVSTKSPRFFN